MAGLACYVLGGFELRQGGERLLLPPTVKSQSLLAYLILYRHQAHPRDHLADLFWGDRPERKARQSLSTALWHIRRALPDANILVSTPHIVQIHPQADIWLDAEQFEQRMQASPMEDITTHITRLQEALALYRGELLAGYYDDWLMNDRYHLELLFLDGLARLMRCHEARQDYPAVLETGLRLLKQAPLREDAHRAVMRAYYRLGQRNAALQHFHRCRAIIRNELGTEPTAETTQLYEAILNTPETPRPVLDTRRPAPFPASDPFRTPSRPVAPAAHPSPFVGREKEMGILRDAWEHVVKGRGRCVFILGEAGIGKSRLAEEFAQSLRQHGQEVVTVNCYEHEHTLPYGPMAEIAQAVVALGGDNILQELSVWQQAALAYLLPRDRLQGTLEGQEPPLADTDRPRLFSTLTRLLIRAAQRNAFFLLVEDVHWAHPSMVAWIHHLVRHMTHVPLMLVITARSDAIAAGTESATLLERIQHHALTTTLLLSRLSKDALARWMEGAERELVDEMHHHTEGNPLFVLETLRSLVDEAYLRYEDGRWQQVHPAENLPVPASIRQAIQMRLNRLNTRTRAALDIAALLGRSFDFDVLDRAWGVGQEATLEALDELLRHHIIREGRGPFARDYVFDHHLIDDIVVDAIPPTRSQHLHRRIADALVALHGNDTGVSAEIAYHYMRARAWEQAHEYLFQAGTLAGRVAADSEALDYYRKAVAAYEQAFGGHWDPLRRAMLERRIGESYFRQGEHAQAVTHLRRALTWLGHPLPESRTALRLQILTAIARWGLSTLAPRWQAFPSEWKPPARVEEEIHIYTLLGWVFALLAEHEPYLLVSLRALNRSRANGFVQGAAVAATALGFAADFIPQFRIADHFHRRAQAMLDRVQDPATIGFVYQGLAYHAYLLGRLKEVQTYAQRSAAAYVRGNDPHRWALAVLLQVYVHQHRGELARAWSLAQDLKRVGEETEDMWARCVGEGILGTLLRSRGETEKAQEHLQRAFRWARDIPDYMSQIEIGGELARCFLARDAWEDAVQLVQIQQDIAHKEDVRGDSLGRFLNARAAVYLGVVEHHNGPERSQWLDRAGQACHDALRGARSFRPGMAEAQRLCGRWEWLRGNFSAARTWWERSLATAESGGQRLDRAHTLLEMGHRLDDPPLKEQGQHLLTELGAHLRVF